MDRQWADIQARLVARTLPPPAAIELAEALHDTKLEDARGQTPQLGGNNVLGPLYRLLRRLGIVIACQAPREPVLEPYRQPLERGEMLERAKHGTDSLFARKRSDGGAAWVERARGRLTERVSK